MLARKPFALVLAAATTVALAGPALADATALVGVTYTTTDGTRQFAVKELDGTTDLAPFTFGPEMTKPFRTIVKDQNRLLSSSGYQVNASMTNLYLRTASGHDYTTYIPSSALSISYGSNPLLGTSTLPVSPKVLLTGAAGVLGTCADTSVAMLLGLPGPLASPLDAAGLLGLTAPLRGVCTQLANVVSTPISTVATATSLVLDTALSLANLPFALSGAQQGGAFTLPSYAGTVAAGDGAASSAQPPTTKRIMAGTSLVGTGANLTGLLGTLTTALHSQLDSLPAVGTGAKLTLTQAQAGLSAVQPALASALASALDATQLTALLNKLTATVQTLTGADLSSVSGTYDAYPVLTVAPSASKAGSYDGTLVVDYIETGP